MHFPQWDEYTCGGTGTCNLSFIFFESETALERLSNTALEWTGNCCHVFNSKIPFELQSLVVSMWDFYVNITALPIHHRGKGKGTADDMKWPTGLPDNLRFRCPAPCRQVGGASLTQAVNINTTLWSHRYRLRTTCNTPEVYTKENLWNLPMLIRLVNQLISQFMINNSIFTSIIIIFNSNRWQL